MTMASPLRATYRLQLRPEFGFDDAANITDYLARLGISHAYASPYLQAAEGSAHGYDVVDHSKVNDELGGEPAHRRFVDALHRAQLGQVVDVVPNHMAIGSPRNRWWWDVLENGRSSRFAEHFDIDWDPAGSRQRSRLLMPILGDHYGRVLERGELAVEWADPATFLVRYFDHALPLSPRSVAWLLARAARRVTSHGADHLAFIGHSLGRLLSRTDDAAADIELRHRDKIVLYEQLERLSSDMADVDEAVNAEVAAVNADPDALDSLLDLQIYRLAYWRTAGDELGYRRFFDINSLVGLRVEAAEVFGDTHHLILRWVNDGEVDGLRIDHPDGLRDPQAYFQLLRAAAPEAWIVAEKILEPGEELPAGWPIDGTTGYDFCHLVTRLLHDARGVDPIIDLYEEVTRDDQSHDSQPSEGQPYDETVFESKLAVLRGALATDVNRVVAWFQIVAAEHRRWRDFTRRELLEAIVESAASMPVYRSYVGPDGKVTDHDRSVITEALAVATERRPDLDAEVFQFLGLVLTAELDAGPGPATELRMRFQQLTGPVMAKGVEDTVFYDRVPLASLNEVGADPSIHAIEPDTFHHEMANAARTRPRSMLALSTHDTKRSEDVRARLAVLSEVPGAWAEALHRWLDMADPHRAAAYLGGGAEGVDGADGGVDGWPDPRMEQLLFQTLVGAHPLSADRAVEYMAKATKEAKRNTSWTDPVAAYDEAVESFVRSVCADGDLMSDLAAFVEPLVAPGRINSLAQKLVCLTAPGVPDIYQGTELWDLSLVDPDNRRPVDYGRRRGLLDELAGGLTDPSAIWDRADDGLPKLWTVMRALQVRAQHPECFVGGTYEPLGATGPAALHVVAFSRGSVVGGARAITVVPRLPVGLEAGGGWRGTVIDLPDGLWHDALSGATWSGGEVEMSELLGGFPVALLHMIEGAH